MGLLLFHVAFDFVQDFVPLTQQVRLETTFLFDKARHDSSRLGHDYELLVEGISASYFLYRINEPI